MREMVDASTNYLMYQVTDCGRKLEDFSRALNDAVQALGADVTGSLPAK
jgi:hypothetical protein